METQMTAQRPDGTTMHPFEMLRRCAEDMRELQEELEYRALLRKIAATLAPASGGQEQEGGKTMAKISARGAHELFRYHPIDPGRTAAFLVRSDGVILVKWMKDCGWSKYGRTRDPIGMRLEIARDGRYSIETT